MNSKRTPALLTLTDEVLAQVLLVAGGVGVLLVLLSILARAPIALGCSVLFTVLVGVARWCAVRGRLEGIGWLVGCGVEGAAAFAQVRGLGVHDTAAQFALASLPLTALLLSSASFVRFVMLATAVAVTVACVHALGLLPHADPELGTPIDFALAPLLVAGFGYFLHTMTSGLRAARATIDRERTQFRDVFESASDGILLLDADGRILSANNAFAVMIDADLASLSGRDVRDLGARAEGGRDIPIGDGRFEWRIQRAGRPALVGEVAARATQSDEGARALWLVRDVTEQRSRVASEHQADKMQMLGQLAASVAHDFNNRLAGIVGMAELISLLPPTSPRRDELAERIAATGLRASHRAEQILSFGRKDTSPLVPVDLDAGMGTIAAGLEGRLGHGVALRLELGAASPWVLGVAGRIEDAILNLAINARDALNGRGGTITLRTRAIHAGPNGDPAVEIEVQDDGVGMDEETLARAVDPFFSRKPGGVGLGLASVQGLAASHNGGLRIASRLGAGTTVCLWLPACPAPAAQPQEDGARLEGWRVLLAEDDDGVAAVTADRLRELGAEVTVARDGDEAHAALQAPLHFDLAVFDVVMPGMPVFGLVAYVRANRPALPVVVVSGSSVAADMDPMLRLGKVAFLRKPYPGDRLVAAARSLR